MTTSLVIETWNLGGAIESGVAPLLDRIRAQSLTPDELIVTHDRLDAAARARLDARAGRAITWVELPPGADYYQHKNHGFDASTGAVVAFTDGDCAPSPRWLEHLTSPITGGAAQVVAGATVYTPHVAAAAGTLVDFPVYPSPLAAGAVRNFFANNVAFARDVFAARRYPDIPAMFHGQCQVLALALQADRIVVHRAARATLEHAWPDGPRDWLRMRLLRGADTVAFTPHMLRAYAPRLARPLAHLGPLPALALLTLRAAHATTGLLRTRPTPASIVAGLALIAVVTATDSAGALLHGDRILGHKPAS